MGYWEDRLGKSITNFFDKNAEQARKQLIKYYKKAMEDVVGQFEKTYQHLLSSMDEGREPTPADLYNLDKYWEMQAQLKTKLQKLGDTTYKVMSDNFVNQFKSVYEGLELPFSARAFNTLSDENINQMILQIWCADGKSWSDRIWTNTDKLQQALNDNLINCVLTGKKPTELKQMLMKDFNVSFNNADTIVRTEMAHIQTQAAKNRYMDAGISEVEVLVDKDERTCPICSKLANKRYPIKGVMPVPAHPRCRCCIIPIFDSLTLSKPYANMNESKLIGVPANTTSGSNEEIREWYYVNIHDIPTRLDYSLPLEERAKQANKMRSDIMIEARAAMKDRAKAESLNKDKPPISFEEMIANKMDRYGFETREEALQDIIRSASTPNEDVNKKLFGGK